MIWRINQIVLFRRVRLQINLQARPLKIPNVVAARRGTDPELRDEWIESQLCSPRRPVIVEAGEEDNWGFGSGNRRAITRGVTISPDNVADLRLRWSLAIPGATEMRSQPVAALRS